MSELPRGWVQVPIGSIAAIETGFTPPKKNPEFYGGDIPFYKPGDLDLGMYTAQAEEYVTAAGADAGRLFPAGTVLVTCIGNLGKTAILEREAIANQQINAILPTKAASPEFLFYWLKTIRPWLAEHSSATTVTIINKGRFSNAPILLPPEPEQNRIVAKLDSLRARSARARHELDLVPKLIERYKQAILAKAFSGELTAGWRAHSRSEELGPRDAGQMGLDDQERGEWSTTVLPAGWEWRRFSDFFSDQTDSSRKLQQKAYAQQGRYPVIDQGEAFIGGFTSDQSLLSPAKPPTVLFGDHTRCVKYIDFEFVQGADGTKVLKPAPDIMPRFAYFALLAIRLPDKGYSRHMKFVRASLFPYCSELEQHEIIRRIEAAFAWLDKIAAEHARADHLLPKLDQAILAKAFRGELVPQDPNDEPASALLERIRAERDGGEQPRRRRARA